MMNDDQIQEIKAKYPDVELVLVETVKGDAVFRCPTAGEYRRFMDQVGEKKTAGALESLVKNTCVHPDAVTFSGWCASKPGIPAECANHITTLAGVTGEAVAKKL